MLKGWKDNFYIIFVFEMTYIRYRHTSGMHQEVVRWPYSANFKLNFPHPSSLKVNLDLFAINTPHLGANRWPSSNNTHFCGSFNFKKQGFFVAYFFVVTRLLNNYTAGKSIYLPIKWSNISKKMYLWVVIMKNFLNPLLQCQLGSSVFDSCLVLFIKKDS